jgi:hypothetical protein
MPSSLHSSFILVSGFPTAAIAKRSLAVVILNGRPRYDLELGPKPTLQLYVRKSARAQIQPVPQNTKDQLTGSSRRIDRCAVSCQHFQSNSTHSQIMYCIDEMA